MEWNLPARYTRRFTVNNNYTLEQVQDLYDWMNWNVKEGYLDEDIANDIIDAQDWDEASRLRDLGDLFAESILNEYTDDEYIRDEPVSDYPEWAIK